MSTLLTYMENLGFSLKKVSTVRGGEFSSGCPACGDGGKGSESDRFHIWPEKDGGGLCQGRFWCRQCGTTGDTIEFLKKFHNMDFRSACIELGITPPGKNTFAQRRFIPSPTIPETGPRWQPRSYKDPSSIWQEKAHNLLEDCKRRLASEPMAIEWLVRRGITETMIDHYQLGYNQSSKGSDRYRPRSSWGLPEKKGRNDQPAKLWIPRGWVIPSFATDGKLLQLRIRRLDEDIQKFAGHIKYAPVDGSSMATMVLHPEADVFVTVECGFDAILIAGLLGGRIGSITTWNASARPDKRAHAILSQAALILNGLDYDHAGNKEQKWWDATYKNNRRLQQPGVGINDPGEAYEAGIDIRNWVIDALPRGLKIKLGFDKSTQKPTPLPEQAPATEQEKPVIVEIDLANGTTIYVTDDPDEWHALTRENKPVFSRNEIERLKLATSSMTSEERLAAAMQAIEVKQMFAGYIRDGRKLVNHKTQF